MPEIHAFCGLAIVYVALSLLSPDPKNPSNNQIVGYCGMSQT